MRTLGELLLSDRKYATFADIARDLIGQPWAGFVTEVDVLGVLGCRRRRRHDRHHRLHALLVAEPVPVDPHHPLRPLLFALNAMTIKAFGETEF